MHEYIRETSSWNTKTVNAVVVGLLLPVLGASTAGVVIGRKNAWKDMNF